MNEIEILCPVAATRVQACALATRGPLRPGARIGWLDNRKANAGALLADVAASLSAKGHEFEPLRVCKDATAAAPADVMAHLKTCDAVVLAIAD